MNKITSGKTTVLIKKIIDSFERCKNDMVFITQSPKDTLELTRKELKNRNIYFTINTEKNLLRNENCTIYFCSPNQIIELEAGGLIELV